VHKRRAARPAAGADVGSPAYARPAVHTCFAGDALG
jgi:hypothetical protein